MVHSFLFVALLAVIFPPYILATQRNSPAAGSLTVGSSGHYKTISAAVAAAKEGESIFIYAGTYNESVFITVDNLTIYGQTEECVYVPSCFVLRGHRVADTTADITQSTLYYESNTVTIISSNCAQETKGSDDASATLRVWANSIAIYNVNVVNSYGFGSPALALSAYGTQQVGIFRVFHLPYSRDHMLCS